MAFGTGCVVAALTACEPQPRNAATSTSAEALPDIIWVTNAWVRAGDSAALTGAYATVHNPRDSAAQIVGARSAAADTVELHETMQHDGMVHMEAQTEIALAARDSVVFAPGGKHFMLRGLRRALVEGEQVPVQLLLRNGDTIRFTAAVRSITGQ